MLNKEERYNWIAINRQTNYFKTYFLEYFILFHNYFDYKRQKCNFYNNRRGRTCFFSVDKDINFAVSSVVLQIQVLRTTKRNCSCTKYNSSWPRAVKNDKYNVISVSTIIILYKSADFRIIFVFDYQLLSQLANQTLFARSGCTQFRITLNNMSTKKFVVVCENQQ